MLRLFFRPEEWDSAAAASRAARRAALGGGAEADDAAAIPGTPGIDVDAILAQATSALAGIASPAPAAGHAARSDASGAGGGHSGGGGGGAKMMAVTVGAQFKTQLSELLTVVRATTPHYVRCLKPNAAQVRRGAALARPLLRLPSTPSLYSRRRCRASWSETASSASCAAAVCWRLCA